MQTHRLSDWKERRKACTAAWQRKNKEKLNSYNRERRKIPEILEKRREHSRNNYRKNSVILLRKHKEWRTKLRCEVIDHYGRQCVCCGEKHLEFLTIDHIGGEGKKQKKQIGIGNGTAFYCWIKRNNYPDTLRVLCYNCNCSLGANKYCPHSSVPSTVPK